MFSHKLDVDDNEVTIFLSSDQHMDSSEFHEELWKNEMDTAMKRNARIFMNGDWSSSLLPGDIKRFTNSRSAARDVDNLLNQIIDNAFKKLLPYVDNIDLIGCGNHETSVLKHHSLDMTQILVWKLNEKRNKELNPIVYAGYTGFVTVSLGAKKDDSKRIFDIFFNHGQGGSSAVTKGTIDLQRRSNIDCDLIWLGHKHTKVTIEMDQIISVNHVDGKIVEKRRRGVITGGYEKNIHQSNDLSETGYILNYGEMSMRTPQQYGGYLLTLQIKRDENGTRKMTSKIEDIAF